MLDRRIERAEQLGHQFFGRATKAEGSRRTSDSGVGSNPSPAEAARCSAPLSIQRDVGFEFETGWLVYEQIGINGPFKSLKKKDLVDQIRGFKIEADEAEGDLSELEFIVHPPVPTKPGFREGLEFTMDYISVYGESLLSAAGKKPFFRLNEVTGRPSDKKFMIKSRDKILAAGPQVTAGLDLASIPKLGESKGLPDSFKRSVMTVASINETIQEANLAKFLPNGKIGTELRGLMTLLTSLLWGGENRGLEYPKQIADVFLLARTDLATIFGLLPKDDKIYYQERPRDFVELVLTAADLAGTDDVQVIEHGIGPKKTRIGPTRSKWLFFITQGFDLLSHSVNTEFESMGEFGSKTESVGPNDRDAGIFELRGAQTTKIPLEGWKPFALQAFDYITSLESN